ESIYALRREILDGKIRVDEDESVDSSEYLMALAEDMLGSMIEMYAPPKADFETWDLDALKREANRVFGIETGALDFSDRTSAEISDALWQKIVDSYEEKEKLIGPEILRRVERDIMLQVVDQHWKDHLYSLDHLKEGIGLRGYGQRDPLVEYKKESFGLFQAMKERVDEEIVRYLWWLRPILNEEGPAPPTRPVRRPRPPLILSGGEAATPSFGAMQAQTEPASPFGAPRRQQPPRVGGDDAKPVTVRRDEPKVGRNDPCPCGSGKK